MPQEYWHEGIVLKVSGAIGTPVVIDSTTMNRVFGHYARILVDIYFSHHMFDEIMVERDSYSFKVEVSYE